VIGDAPRDIEAGKAAGCRTILIHRHQAESLTRALEKHKMSSRTTSARPSPKQWTSSSRTPKRGARREPTRPKRHAAPRTATRRAAPAPRCTPPPAKPADATATRPLTSIEKLMARAAVQSGDNPTSIAVPRPHPRPPPPPRPAVVAETLSDPQPPRAAPTPPPSSPATASKLESIALDILHELRRRHELPQQDFSVSKLLAGITQVVVLAMLFLAFLNRNSRCLNSILLFALTLQAMTIALLIMQRQR
jgi:hypothetical protein